MPRRRIGQETFEFTSNNVGRSSLDELARLIDWTEIDRCLAGIYASAKGEASWPPVALFKAMLLSVWYNLSDVQLADSLDDRASFRRFCGFAAHEATLRCRYEGATCPALQKRDLGRADDVDNESLRQQGLDEPAGLEQRWIIPAVEDVEHGEESGVVEDRADWPDEHHELENIADVPFPRNHEIVLVDIVGRNRRLREIIDQVVGEHLDRQHWQEGQKDAGTEHAEHIAEITARTHLDIFGDITKHLPPFDNAFLQHH